MLKVSEHRAGEPGCAQDQGRTAYSYSNEGPHGWAVVNAQFPHVHAEERGEEREGYKDRGENCYKLDGLTLADGIRGFLNADRVEYL